MPDSLHIAYYDINNNLIEAFTLSNGFDFTYYTYDLFQPYDRSMYIWKGIEYSFGETCFTTYAKYSVEHVEWCDKYLNMYSLHEDYVKDGYWKVISVYEKKLSDFCIENPLVIQSFSCNDGMTFRYDEYELIILKEHYPASFELVCEPEKVKKGETSNCKLKIRATEEITKVVVPIESDFFEIVNFDEVDSWELTDNKDGTVTIVPELEFKGSATILGGTFKFKDDLIDEVNVELNDISYTTVDGFEFEGNAGDNINIYEEPVEDEEIIKEDKKEEIKNPDTVDFFDIVLLCILLTILVLFMSFRIKKELR